MRAPFPQCTSNDVLLMGNSPVHKAAGRAAQLLLLTCWHRLSKAMPVPHACTPDDEHQDPFASLWGRT